MADEVAAKQDGRKKPMYPVKMPQQMHSEVLALAAEIGGTPNDVIVEAIKLAFSRPEFLVDWQQTKRQQKIDELEAELLRLRRQE